MSAAEKVAMAAAIALNKEDSIGQMNYILAHSRELIVCSRYNETDAHENHQSYEMLARDLAQKAHENAQKLTELQSNLEKYRMNQAIAAAKEALATAGSPGSAHMTGVSTTGVTINFEQSYFGCAKKVPSDTDSPDNIADSNVKASTYHLDSKIDSLLMDYDKKFIDEKSQLYKGNLESPMDLNFPGGGDDPDLSFPISSLPPCVDNYVSPPRLIKQSEFQKLCPLNSNTQPRYIPSAVCIVLQLDVKDSHSGTTNQLMAPGYAITGGASASP